MKKSHPPLPDDKDAHLAEVEALKRQIYHLRMEYDILEKTAELSKKDQGISPRELANAQKARVIDALRDTYPLQELLNKLELSKSNYFYQREAHSAPDKYCDLHISVREVFSQGMSRYEFRQIHVQIKRAGL